MSQIKRFVTFSAVVDEKVRYKKELSLAKCLPIAKVRNMSAAQIAAALRRKKKAEKKGKEVLTTLKPKIELIYFLQP